MIITALVFLLILSVLVLIHEAGHYFVAKKFGIKVEEFGFGFPLTPPIWQKKKGETVYSFYPLLIGGFVKLYGEDEAGAGRIEAPKEMKKASKEELDRAFVSKPLWQRTSVVIAGVVMNVLLAAVIYYVFLFMSNFSTQLPLIGQHDFVGVNEKIQTQIVVTEISPGSPAEQAGIEPFSAIESLNGEKIVEAERFAEIIQESAGDELRVGWVNVQTGEQSEATVVPRQDPPPNEGSLGVGFYPNQTVTLSYDTFTQKIFSGFIHPYNLMAYNFDILGQLINVSIREGTAEPISQGVSGPVGIFSVVGAIIDIPDVKERVLQLLNLAGLLSISLAFFNILPIPGLDGGRLFFILLEAAIGKKINPKVEGYIHAIGMIFLLGLLLLVTIKDINQFF